MITGVVDLPLIKPLAQSYAQNQLKHSRITVENLGGRPLAFSIKVNYADKTSSLEEGNPVVWTDKSVYNKKIESKTEIISIQLKVPTNGDAIKDNNILIIRK